MSQYYKHQQYTNSRHQASGRISVARGRDRDHVLQEVRPITRGWWQEILRMTEHGTISASLPCFSLELRRRSITSSVQNKIQTHCRGSYLGVSRLLTGAQNSNHNRLRQWKEIRALTRYSRVCRVCTRHPLPSEDTPRLLNSFPSPLELQGGANNNWTSFSGRLVFSPCQFQNPRVLADDSCTSISLNQHVVRHISQISSRIHSIPNSEVVRTTYSRVWSSKDDVCCWLEGPYGVLFQEPQSILKIHVSMYWVCIHMPPATIIATKLTC